MSTLNVANIQSLTTSTLPVIKNSAGTEVGQFARAWALLDGTGTASRTGNFNVSAITDNGTGHYTLTFATALPNANYCAVASGCLNNSGDTSITSIFMFDFTTTTIKLKTFRLQSNTATPRDFEQISVAIFGD